MLLLLRLLLLVVASSIGGGLWLIAVFEASMFGKIA
jgi:hypothetical protein